MNEPTVQEAPSKAESERFRSQVGHISRHSGVFFAGTLFTVALGYLFKVYLARVLGAEALGIYALGLTLTGFVGFLNSLGLTESAVRFAAVYKATDKFEQLRALLWRGGAILVSANVVFFALFLALGGIVARRFYHSPDLARYVPWFATLMLLGIVSTFYGKVLGGYKVVGPRTFITNFVGTPAMMLLSVSFVGLGYGLGGYLLAQVIASFLVILLLLRVVLKNTPVEAKHVFPWPRRLEPEVWSFSGAAIVNLFLEFVLAHVDRVALGYYLGAVKVGIYSIAAGMVAYVSLVLVSVNQVFSPVIADLHARNDRGMLQRLYKALTKWVLGLTLPLAITVMVYARPIMRIFGHDFEGGWPILVIGTAGQLVNCGVGSVGLLLWMSGNQKLLLRVQAVMAIFMVVATIVLIPIWGILGAAVAAALTNTGTNLLNLWTVRRVLGLSPYSRSFMRLLVPAAVTVLVALILKREAGLFSHDWVAIGVALLATYALFAAVSAALGFDEDDRLIGRAIWNRIRRTSAWNGIA